MNKPRKFAGGVMAAALLIAGCSPKSDTQSPSQGKNVTLTQEQRQKIHVYTLASGKFRKTIDTTGVVDFDNDQATSVLAPFSGPVSRLLVSAGDKVTKGEPLAEVDSPDFAAAVSAYGKALAIARTNRRLADID